MYRFDKEGTQWKERGVGQVKLLEHKSTKKVRLLMRQNRTLKICANHMGKLDSSTYDLIVLFVKRERVYPMFSICSVGFSMV